jgi:hypothetical protein
VVTTLCANGRDARFKVELHVRGDGWNDTYFRMVAINPFSVLSMVVEIDSARRYSVVFELFILKVRHLYFIAGMGWKVFLRSHTFLFEPVVYCWIIVNITYLHKIKFNENGRVLFKDKSNLFNYNIDLISLQNLLLN